MAVTATQLAVIASGTGGTPATSFATPSITPTANRLVLAAFAVFKSSGCTAPTSVTGNGLTWVKVIERDLLALGIVNTSVWRALGASPSSGAVTANFGATMSACVGSVAEFAGVDTSGTNGSGAVRQSAYGEGTSTSPLATLAAFGHVDNATFGTNSVGSLIDMTPGSGFTSLGDSFEFANNLRIETEWKASNDTSVDGTLGSSGNWTMLAVEIVAAGAAPPTTSFPPLRPRRPRPNLMRRS